MTGYAYTGACDALIEEDWHGDTQFLRCPYGRGMQCEGSADPSELCYGCSQVGEADYYG